MAQIKKLKNNKYYSYVRWYDETGHRDGKYIALKTSKKSKAVMRNHQVEKVEDLIKQGENWNFGWLKDGGKPILIRLSIEDAIEKFYAVKRLDNLKPRTFEAYEQGLKNLRSEGLGSKSILTGDLMADLVKKMREQITSQKIQYDDYCLLTLHRPASVDNPRDFNWIIQQVANLEKMTIQSL